MFNHIRGTRQPEAEEEEIDAVTKMPLPARIGRPHEVCDTMFSVITNLNFASRTCIRNGIDY